MIANVVVVLAEGAAVATLKLQAIKPLLRGLGNGYRVGVSDMHAIAYLPLGVIEKCLCVFSLVEAPGAPLAGLVGISGLPCSANGTVPVLPGPFFNSHA